MTDSSLQAPRSSVGSLTLGAIGVVFGDIGTSPLYALKETFAGAHPLSIDEPHVLGALSLLFWAMMCSVSLKYVLVILRADNKGEGGTLALFALLHGRFAGRSDVLAVITVLGVFATALFYGDSMITPAISVLSAVEGVGVAAPELQAYVVPASIVILILLFMVQRHGTARVGNVFGPVIVIWFAVLAASGIASIAAYPRVLWALSPHHAIAFLASGGSLGFFVLAAIFLAMTGAEALYADLGHFGRLPIRLAWYFLVMPALIINYFGQGALLLSDPSALENPFFRLVPEALGMPLVVLATMATVIASQATISGAFSVTHQAIQLGYMPRMGVVHTSAREKGQIFIPFLNSVLMVAVILLVLGFPSSTKLADAYGLAVTGIMVITTVLIGLVMRAIWNWRWRVIVPLLALFLAVDVAFLSANVTKIPTGGWLPLTVAGVLFVLLTTWKCGRAKIHERLRRDSITLAGLLASLSGRVAQVPGTAIYFTRAAEEVPSALLHTLKHTKALHEHIVLLTVQVEDVPWVAAWDRVESQTVDARFRRLVLHFGFMEETDVPKTLANATHAELGFDYEPMATSYFMSREMVVPNPDSAMPGWRQRLFMWMSRNASAAWSVFQLPLNQVVEFGTLVTI